MYVLITFQVTKDDITAAAKTPRNNDLATEWFRSNGRFERGYKNKCSGGKNTWNVLATHNWPKIRFLQHRRVWESI